MKKDKTELLIGLVWFTITSIPGVIILVTNPILVVYEKLDLLKSVGIILIVISVFTLCAIIAKSHEIFQKKHENK
jgi:hypothetical protein